MKQIFGIFTILLSGILNAQTINGKIISKENNETIPFARIGIENENFGAIADENGNYSIDLTNIDRNKNLTIQIGGFINFSQSIQNFINGNHTISLTEKVVEIQEVILNPKNIMKKIGGQMQKLQKFNLASIQQEAKKTNQKNLVLISATKKK